MSNYQHWQLERDSAGILWLGFDKKDALVNTIDESVLDELSTILSEVDTNTKGLVIHSLKKKGFIAGADINHFKNLKDTDVAVAFLRKGQDVFDKLEKLPYPTVAMMDGFCLGGGTELVLACDYRIMSDSDDSRIGLPEILLGIHPGWGGTVRLPNLIGGLSALGDVILSGRMIRASRAKKMGMVDVVVPYRHLKRAAIQTIEQRPAKHQPTTWQKMTNHAMVRPVLAKLMKKKVSQRVRKEHYPAPFAVIDNWLRDGANGARAMIAEADSIGALIAANDTAKNLVRAFFLREQMKGFGKHSQFKAKRVHVVGAGVMGGDIAAWCALKGLQVTLEDREYKYIAPAIARAHKLFKKKLRKPRLVQAAMDRLTPDVKGIGAATSDVIIEAIFENLEAKQALFKRLETQAKPSAILASNTSSIPLDEINRVMQQPERLVGIHFFNPVSKMELVEVVKGKLSIDKVVQDACSFVDQIARLPLPVASSPGFLVNRVLMPYLMECVALLDEGYSGEAIDKAAQDFGMFMGPVELADTVGLDVCLAVAENLTQHFGGSIPDRLVQMVKDGQLGRKTNKGFYTYKKGKAVKKSVSKIDAPGEEIAHRLILRMVNEACACLREGVVESADLVDAGMIFGTGFAPFRGGPMQYAHDFGQGQLSDLFEQLQKRYGERFKADSALSNLITQ